MCFITHLCFYHPSTSPAVHLSKKKKEFPSKLQTVQLQAFSKQGCIVFNFKLSVL